MKSETNQADGPVLDQSDESDPGPASKKVADPYLRSLGQGSVHFRKTGSTLKAADRWKQVQKAVSSHTIHDKEISPSASPFMATQDLLGEKMSKNWQKMRTAVKVRGVLGIVHEASVVKVKDEEEAFLASCKQMYDDDRQSFLGVHVGHNKHALVVKLSEDKSLKHALHNVSKEDAPSDDETDSNVGIPCKLPLIDPLSPPRGLWLGKCFCW
jgi:hypothetical protein